MALINCPECRREISDSAVSCPGCGHPISRQKSGSLEIVRQQEQKWSPGIAAVLSLVIPGAGQMYKGSVGSGLLWLLFVAIGYALFPLGLILHLICVITAASGS